MGKAVNLLSVCRQVGAHLWHRGPVVSRQQRDWNLQHFSASDRRSNQLSYLLLLLCNCASDNEHCHVSGHAIILRFSTIAASLFIAESRSCTLSFTVNAVIHNHTWNEELGVCNSLVLQVQPWYSFTHKEWNHTRLSHPKLARELRACLCSIYMYKLYVYLNITIYSMNK